MEIVKCAEEGKYLIIVDKNELRKITISIGDVTGNRVNQGNWDIKPDPIASNNYSIIYKPLLSALPIDMLSEHGLNTLDQWK